MFRTAARLVRFLRSLIAQFRRGDGTGTVPAKLKALLVVGFVADQSLEY